MASSGQSVRTKGRPVPGEGAEATPDPVGGEASARATAAPVRRNPVVRGKTSPTEAQRRWLRRGLGEPGGKLPLFDDNGRRVDSRIIRACLEHGWAEPWFRNPIKPDWLVCRLTSAGRRQAGL